MVAAMSGARTRGSIARRVATRWIGGIVLAGATSCGGSVGTAPVADLVEAPQPEAGPAEPAVKSPEPTPAAAPVEPVQAEPARVPEKIAEPTGHADLDPDNDQDIGPPPVIDDCEARLAEADVKWKAARIGVGRKVDGVYTCGSPQVVRYRSGPEKIAYSTSPLLTCGMALALADFERIVQEEAERELGRRVTKIEHLGTYNCRQMAAYDLISEHSYANAIDLRRFHLEGGGTVDVLKDFRPADDAPADPKTRFLRALSSRLYDERIFSVVVTPFFDALHRNHIHVDLARYRVDGSRP